MQEHKAIIAAAVRTPFGAYFGALSKVRPDDLLGFTISELVKKVPNLNPELIDDVIMGDANGAGEDNRNVARMGALLAGLPESIPGATINRLCGSGGEAVIQASRAIRLGDYNYVIAGGVESMSRAPWIVERGSKNKPESTNDLELHQSTVGWRMTNPKFPENWVQSLGRCAEEVSQRFGITRAHVDEWSLRSHQRAAIAWDKKIHDDFALPFNGLTIDESIRRDTSLEKLANLPSAFSEGGTGTAGNSSPINDGAVAMLITNEINCAELGLPGIGRILATQVTATKPNEFSRAPVTAIHKVLKKVDKKVSDIKVWEINEAFASMVLTVLHEIPEINPDQVNINGGAIAMGHPIGGSAARVIVDCAHELKRQGGGIGIAAACIGVGLGIAVVIEVAE
ncbi:MAG: thiolase family protein [Acidobacteria bacterium]|nr:thiolase family protein [Acidobacteriota bacterium]